MEFGNGIWKWNLEMKIRQREIKTKVDPFTVMTKIFQLPRRYELANGH